MSLSRYPYLRPLIDNRQIDEAPLDIARVRDRLATARWHGDRAMAVREAFPDDHPFHLEKAYDALRAAAGGVLAAHGVRTIARGRTHAIPFEIAVAALRGRQPDVAHSLGRLAGSLRAQRNRIQYEIVEDVTEGECDEVFAALPTILEALEAVAYDLMGLPAPGGWMRAT